MRDIRGALDKAEFALLLGWNDIAKRYRRSFFGGFWLTISMAILIGTLGLIFGALFGLPLAEYLPHVSVGLIFWAFMSGAITEGCSAFIQSQNIILQIRLPFFLHVIRVFFRNLVTLGHNILIYPLVMLIVAKGPGITVLLAIPGFILMALNLLWIMTVLSVLCARYRDLIQIVQNLLQVLFYATPIMWLPETLAGKPIIEVLKFNPFYHLLAIVRDPLTGSPPETVSWTVCIAGAIAGWLIALLVLGRSRRHIPFWL
ncbi:ABC transporter permease [Zhengella mangrovi]|nr:ABC transporter permease [Zhengella mangrovi]